MAIVLQLEFCRPEVLDIRCSQQKSQHPLEMPPIPGQPLFQPLPPSHDLMTIRTAPEHKEQEIQGLIERIEGFAQRNGHLAIPTDYVEPDGFMLGIRASKLRYLARASNIPEHQHQKLLAMGFLLPRPFLSLLAKLREFVQENGHGRVPNRYITASGYDLDTACRTYRAKARRPDFPVDMREQLTQAGFVFELKGRRKDKPVKIPLVLNKRDISPGVQKKILDGFEAFKQQHGHVDVPVRYVSPEGLRLGWQLNALRSSFKNGSISDAFSQALLDLGVRLAYLDTDHYSSKKRQKPVLDALEAFKREHGHVDVPARYVNAQGLKLGLRLVAARKSHKQGRLSPAFVQALEQMGVQLASRDLVIPQEAFPELLKAYKQKHGDCDVPYGYRDESGYTLGVRCSYERTLAMKPGYSLARRTELAAMGFRFEFKVIDPQGDLLLERVAQFKAEHGHCWIRGSYVCEDGFNLGIRVATLMNKGEKLGRKPLRDKLIEMGVPTTKVPPKRDAEQIVRDVIEYIQAHGTTKIEVRYRCPDGFRLGNWHYMQRVRALKGKEDRDLRSRLEALGVSYDAFNRDGTHRKA